MMLWTIIPIEQVIEGFDKPPTYEEVDLASMKLQIERLSPTEGRIVRIISTNPLDYLQDNLQPGQMLSFRPVLLENSVL